MGLGQGVVHAAGDPSSDAKPQDGQVHHEADTEERADL